MTEKERNEHIRILHEKVEFNKRIHCHYVAARLQREIDKIREGVSKYGTK